MRIGPLIRRSLLLAVALALTGCTAHLAPTQTADGGSAKPAGALAVINVGTTVVRQIDGQKRRGGAFDVSAFEVAPGTHHLVLVFDLPARAIGLKALPAQAGVGVCELTFEAQAGRQYYLVARPLGDFNSPRWSGAWEAWVRDPAVSAEDDEIARCEGTEATPTPTETPVAGAAAGGAAAGAVVAPPTPTPLALPAARALRVGAWSLPQLAQASPADLAKAAATIGGEFDVLTVTPAFAPAPLLGALGGAWAAFAGEGQTILYRRDLVRPCTAPSSATPCLEAVGRPPGTPPLLLHLPTAGENP